MSDATIIVPQSEWVKSAFDERDETIVRERLAQLDAIEGPRVGDYVDFADGVSRRISHDWFGESVQTSDDGRFYMGNGYLSFSGSLFTSVPTDSLTDTGEKRHGYAWIFHHDYRTAHNGVDFQIPMRVYRCSLPAPTV